MNPSTTQSSRPWFVRPAQVGAIIAIACLVVFGIFTSLRARFRNPDNIETPKHPGAYHTIGHSPQQSQPPKPIPVKEGGWSVWEPVLGVDMDIFTKDNKKDHLVWGFEDSEGRRTEGSSSDAPPDVYRARVKSMKGDIQYTITRCN